MSLNSTGMDRNGVLAGGSPQEMARRPWSTPTVIQAELSSTSFFQTSSTDKTDGGVSYGS